MPKGRSRVVSYRTELWFGEMLNFLKWLQMLIYENETNKNVKFSAEKIENLLCAAVGTASHLYRLETCTVYGDTIVCSCRHSKSSVSVRNMYCCIPGRPGNKIYTKNDLQNGKVASTLPSLH
jgi:hypothetical protein